MKFYKVVSILVLVLTIVFMPLVAAGHEKKPDVVIKNCVGSIDKCRMGRLDIIINPIKKTENIRDNVKPIYYVKGDAGRRSFQRFIFVSKLSDFKIRYKN